MPDPHVRGHVSPQPPTATTASDARTVGPRRRRGTELRTAIHAAALEELRQRGFVDLTMDAIAARARTGKASLYRYWPNKLELVIDALNASPDSFAPPPDTGDLRSQLLAVMRYIADELDSPQGLAARSLISELIRSPELAGAVRPHLADPAPAWVLEVLRRAAVHGHVPAAALTPRVAGVGPDIIRAHAIIHGTPVPDTVLNEIVDTVLLPLLENYTPFNNRQNPTSKPSKHHNKIAESGQQ